MQTEIRILTRRENRKEHHETLLTIDWTGITREQLMVLAQWAITHEVQARFYKAEENPPEKHTVVASTLVNNEPSILKKYAPIPKKVRIEKSVLAVFEGMDLEEIKKLLGPTTLKQLEE